MSRPGNLSRAIDDLDDVLRIAAEVVEENAPLPGNTRIERIARWVLARVGAQPAASRSAGSITEIVVDTQLHDGSSCSKDARVVAIGGLVGTERGFCTSPDKAREVAAAILRCADIAERYE